MPSKRRTSEVQLPGWAWMLFGLSMGLAVALVVYLRSDGAHILDDVTELVSGLAPAGDENPEATEPGTSAAAERLEADGTAATGAPDEAELSFYTSLRDSEVVVPGAAAPEPRGSALIEEIELQAGSFPTIERADTRQATLALIGIESRIEPATIDDVIRYRVIVGPLTDLAEIARIERSLDEKNIEFMERRAVD